MEKLNLEFNAVKYNLNNNQMACVIGAVRCKGKGRVFLTIPPGKGKSRVIAGIIAYKSKFENCKKFTIMFSSELLKGVDEKVYQHIQNVFSVSINLVVYNPKVTFGGQTD